MSRLHQSVRTFSLSSARLTEEGEGDSKLKNDPEVKKLLTTIQEDFKSVNATEEPETPKSVKNVSDLLSEIYGEAAESDSKEEEEKKNKFSSLGKMSFNSVLFPVPNTDLQEATWSIRTETTVLFTILTRRGKY